jgi:hypothetical protein
VVELDTSSPLEPDGDTQDAYAHGIGLVQTVALEGPVQLAVLVSGP